MKEDLLIAFILIYKNPELFEEVIEFQRDLNQHIDDKLKLDTRIACEKGCSYCCYGWEVKLTFSELLDFIKSLNNLSNDEKIKTAKRLEDYKRLKDITNQPCPFLDNNLCVVYPSRPFVCRTFSSYDKNLCKTKTPFEFPPILDQIIEDIKEKINTLSDEFIPLFNTKTSVKNINFNHKDNNFFVNLFDTFVLTSENGNLKLKPHKLAEKFISKI
jgi:Fe-S-cluster containining protein